MIVKLILAGIGLFVILFGVTSIIGGAMWDLADKMHIWWNCKEDDEE